MCCVVLRCELDVSRGELKTIASVVSELNEVIEVLELLELMSLFVLQLSLYIHDPLLFSATIGAIVQLNPKHPIAFGHVSGWTPLQTPVSQHRAFDSVEVERE